MKHTSNIIDLRDLVDRRNEIKAEDILTPEEVEELKAIDDLEEQLSTDLEDYADNEPTLIPVSDFTEYVEDDFQQTYDIPDPLRYYIDWDKMANDWKHDYTEVTYDGVDYYVRVY